MLIKTDQPSLPCRDRDRLLGFLCICASLQAEVDGLAFLNDWDNQQGIVGMVLLIVIL
jgi:hypothetical protein